MSNETARKVAQILDDKYHLKDEGVDLKELAVVIDAALKQAPEANPTPGAAWSREKPTEDGYYWYRFYDWSHGFLVTIKGGLLTNETDFTDEPLDTFDGYFSGPLAPPQWKVEEKSNGTASNKRG